MFKPYSIIDDSGKWLETYMAQESPLELGIFIAPDGAIEGEPNIPLLEGKDRVRSGNKWVYQDIPSEIEPEPIPQFKTQFTSLEFLDRFTDQEQLDVVEATMGVAQVKLWYDRLLAASFIDIADIRTAAGLDALITASLLQAHRKAEILAPEPI